MTWPGDDEAEAEFKALERRARSGSLLFATIRARLAME